ncbi:MAG: type II toxin-antitoxin system HicB family antitoxin [Proteobacteria bacterium]|nr:type II toxin-antitoxin system HicB family antitoxin [Pseudomonadota bacterium]
MDNLLKYKGYTGSVNYNADDKLFHGKVLGITDVIGFEGSSVDELEKDFQDAIDDYFDTCKKLEKKPEKPFSGKFVLRLPSELHRDIAVEAKNAEISLNAWITDACQKVLSS